MKSENEKKMLEEIYELRFLDSDKETDIEMEEEIEKKISRYEELSFIFRENNNPEVIPDLCKVIEDEAVESSVVENLSETIALICIANGQQGIKKLIEGMPELIIKGINNALFIHQLIFSESKNLVPYIEVIKKLNNQEKEMMKNFLANFLNEGIFENEVKKIIHEGKLI